MKQIVFISHYTYDESDEGGGGGGGRSERGRERGGEDGWMTERRVDAHTERE